MIEKAIESIQRGLLINTRQIFAKVLPRARFREEINLDIFLRDRQAKSHLMFVKLFKGRPPHYKPWIEIFDIQREIEIEAKTVTYFDSQIENTILRFFSGALRPGQNLFVEYYRDGETLYQLQMDIPFPATRLGFKLYNLGFYWAKDWYFPEGFMEGDQKLQVEKPLDRQAEQRQKSVIYDSLNHFIMNRDAKSRQNEYSNRALKRAVNLVKDREEK